MKSSPNVGPPSWALVLVLSLCACAGPTGEAEKTGNVSPAAGRMAAGLQPLARAGDAETMERLARERGYVLADGAVRVDVQTRGLVADDRGRFDMAGVRVAVFAPRYERVGVWVSTPAALRALSRLTMVRRLAPGYGSNTGR